MASNLLLMLLPFAGKIAKVFLGRLVAEANNGTLPDTLRPYAAEVVEIANFLLPILGGQAGTAPEVKVIG